MRRLFFCDVFCLGPFLALHDFKLNVITLLQAFVAVRLDGAVVDEHIGAVFPTDEAETLCVIEPFNFAFNSRHVLTPSVLGTLPLLVSAPDHSLQDWVLPLLKEGRRTPEVTFSPVLRRLPATLAFVDIFPLSAGYVNYYLMLSNNSFPPASDADYGLLLND